MTIHTINIYDKLDIEIDKGIKDVISLTDTFTHSNTWQLSQTHYRPTWGVQPEVHKSFINYLYENEPEDLYQNITISYKDNSEVCKYNPSPDALLKLMKFLDDLAVCHGWVRPNFKKIEEDLSKTSINYPLDELDNRHLNVKDWLTQIVKYIRDTIPDYQLFFNGNYDQKWGISDKVLRGQGAIFVYNYEKNAKFKKSQFSHVFPVKLIECNPWSIGFTSEKYLKYPYRSSGSIKKTRLYLSYCVHASVPDNSFELFGPVPIKLWVPNLGEQSGELLIDQEDELDHSDNLIGFYDSHSYCVSNNLTCENCELITQYRNHYYDNFSGSPEVYTYVYELTWNTPYAAYLIPTNNTLVLPGNSGLGIHGRAGGKDTYLPIPSEYKTNQDDMWEDAVTAFDNYDPRTIMTYSSPNNTDTSNSTVSHLLGNHVDPSRPLNVGGLAIDFGFFYGLEPESENQLQLEVKQNNTYYVLPIKNRTLRNFYGINFDTTKFRFKGYVGEDTNNNELYRRHLIISYGISNTEYNEHYENKIYYENNMNYKQAIQFVDGVIFTELCRKKLTPNSNPNIPIEFEFDIDSNNFINLTGKYLVIKFSYESFNSNETPTLMGTSVGLGEKVQMSFGATREVFNSNEFPYKPNHIHFQSVIDVKLNNPLYFIPTNSRNFVT